MKAVSHAELKELDTFTKDELIGLTVYQREQNLALIERLAFVDPLTFQQLEDGSFVYYLKSIYTVRAGLPAIPDNEASTWALPHCTVASCTRPRTIKQRGQGLHCYCEYHRLKKMKDYTNYIRKRTRFTLRKNTDKLFQSHQWKCPFKQTHMPEFMK